MAPIDEPPPGKSKREWRPVVTLDRRALVAIIVGVCVLSSAIGAGIGLLAETGPAGAPGKRGPAGPQGPQGPAGASNLGRVEALEAEIEELRGEVAESGELEGRLGDLESALEGLGGASPDALCEELGVFC